MQKANHLHESASNKDIDAHIVAVWNLRVWVTEEDDGFFFAQGLEVDYAAQGSSLEEVMNTFFEGFTRTIDAHLREYKDISNFLKPVSAAVLMDFNARKGEKEPIQCMAISLHLHSAKIEFYEVSKVA
jgi:hypothetical protein